MTIDQVSGGEESFILELKRHRCMREKSQTNFNNVTMLALYCTVLLMSMWTRHMIGDVELSEEGIKLPILPPIELDNKDFVVKLPLNKLLEILKLLKHRRFKIDEINPGEFVKVINKANIILLSLSHPVFRPNRMLIICVPRNQVFTHTVQKMDT
jgi:hypothetical protein